MDFSLYGREQLTLSTHLAMTPKKIFVHKALIVKEKLLTLRRLMSYIYGAPILDVSRSHTTTQHSR